MCLVIGLLLLVMSMNFYLNGFFIQSVITGVAAISVIVFMKRNISCTKGSCKTKNKEDKQDDN